jgi:DNA (cytosine-5)-methyltransferase 1
MKLEKHCKVVMKKKSNKLKTIDLFAGCGGLSLGFQETNLYDLMAHVEWEKAPIEAIREWLISQGEKKSSEKLIHFDIQRLDELFNGWSGDPKYQNGAGLDKLVKSAGGVDLIIGGPPCQAYSIAGRIRDENGMHFDYRNYLFESYLEVVKRYQPNAFVFENEPGMLSAAPGGGSISARVTKAFNEAGYAIVSNLKDAVVDLWNYGVPQKRTRVIIIGLKKDHFTDHQKRLNDFYKKFLPSQAKPVISSQTALSDLPALLPLKKVENANGKKFSHSYPEGSISHHVPRFHSQRDIKIFQLLAKDLQKPKNKRQFQTVEDLKRLYTEQTGKTSAVHKYHVINPEEPSNTIPAHLYKDGLRHIHWDHKQARSLTVREAARLQTFPDLYKFGASQTDAYKMIGNAVPPAFARALALALYEVLSP